MHNNDYCKINKYASVPVIKGNRVRMQRRRNHKNGKFLLDQQYAFPCAAAVEGEASTTVIRMTIPAGTGVRKGFQDMLECLNRMGYEDPIAMCNAMGFTEISSVVGYCGELVDRCFCDQPYTDDEECTVFNCKHIAEFHGRS